MGYYEPGFSFFSPVLYIKIEMNYGSLSRYLTCYLLHNLWLTSYTECQQDSTFVEENRMNGTDMLGYLVELQSCPLAHLARAALKYYLTVLIVILETTISVHPIF